MFDVIRLPEEVEQGARGGPMFQTSVLPLASGSEQRNEDWADPRQVWDIGYGVQDQAGYESVRDFFYARRARARGFLFKDWSDFSVTGQPLGTGDGTTRTFLLVKTYEGTGPNPYLRRITRPVLATLKVYLNGVLTTDYVTGDGGWLRFNAGFAPGAGVAVTADFEFDIPVRFDVDVFPLTLSWVQAGEIQSVPVMETRDPFNAAPTAVNFVNTTASLPENTSTATHVHVADITIDDDPFGTDALTLTGADAASFEIVGTIGSERDGAALYLKAGVALSYALKNSYTVTVNVDDTNAPGAHPAAFATFNLALTNVNNAPSVKLANMTVVEPAGTSTAAPIHVADVVVTDDALGLRALTLSGADAAQFQLTGTLTATGTDPVTGLTLFTGVSLETVAGLDYSVQKTFLCNVDVADSGLPSPPQGSAPFSLSFGITAGTLTDATPGTGKNLVVPNYSTLTIDLYGPGAGGGGYNVLGTDGSGPTQIASLGLIAGQGLAALGGSIIGGLGGTATGGDTNTNGKPGANGIDYTRNLSTVYPTPFNPTGFQFSTAAGGNNADNQYGGISTTGPFYTFSFTTTGADNVNGSAATNVGGGGAGALQYGQSAANVSGGFTVITTYAKGAPGGGGGARVTRVYIYGVTVGAPAPGSTLVYDVGAKGLGGASYATGGDGFDGKAVFTWS